MLVRVTDRDSPVFLFFLFFLFAACSDNSPDFCKKVSVSGIVKILREKGFDFTNRRSNHELFEKYFGDYDDNNEFYRQLWQSV